MSTKAKRRCKIGPASQACVIRAARGKLAEARDYLRLARAKRAADYVARAMKSAEGAERHASRMARP